MKYELMRKGNVVLGRVLEQDENTRATWEDGVSDLYDDDGTGMKICSSTYPELLSDKIYLRGYNYDSDDNYNSFGLTNECEAKEYYNKVKTTLEHYNEFFKDNAVEHDDINTEHITAKTVGDPDILSIQFIRVYEIVMMKIFVQNKEITDKIKSYKTNFNPITTICIDQIPSLANDRVWLRGSDDMYDDAITSINCHTEEKAIVYFDCVCNAIREYVADCEREEKERKLYNGFDDYCIIGG